MLTQYQLYDAFNACKQIYGIDSVHVQLIAKQLGVVAYDVIKYINSNPTLVSTIITKANAGYEDANSDGFGGMTVISVTAIPFISTASIIREGDNGGTITLAITGDTFKNSTSTANWIISAGNTNLTLVSVNTGTTTKVLTFTGTAQIGTLSIQCKAAGMTGGVASDVLYYDVPAVAVDYSTITSLTSRMSAMETLVGAEGGADDLVDRIIALEETSETLVAETSKTIVDGINVADSTDFDVALIENYEDYMNIYLVIATTNGTDGDILLPPATGSMRKIIITNQTLNTVSAVINGTDVINIAESNVDVATEKSVTLIDFADGKWATI